MVTCNAWIGHNLTIDGFFKEKRQLTAKTEEDAVFELIQMEIDADSANELGPPVDILRITKEGAKWIQHKAGCPEIQPIPSAKKSAKSRKRK